MLTDEANPYAPPLAEDSQAPLAPNSPHAIRLKHLGRETSIKSIGTLYYLGVAVVVVALGSAVAWSLADGGPRWDFQSLVTVLWWVLTGTAGVLFWWVGRGLQTLGPPARPVAIGLSFLGLLAIPLGTVISIYMLWLLIGHKAAYIFSPEYKEVIAQTPGVRFKTSAVSWILLILLVLVVALALYYAIGTPAPMTSLS